jgi:hypothetical protein
MKKQGKFTELSYENWADTYKPLTDKYGYVIDFMDDKHKRKLEKARKENKVWTYTDGDSTSFIQQGQRFVNRIAYYITEKPYNPKNHTETEAI